MVFNLQIGQNITRNGGFETGDFTGWALAGNTVSNSVVYNAVESVTNSAPVVHSGSYGAYLGDLQLATLSQTVATMPGQTYLLSLWLENAASGGTQEFRVNWNTNTSAVNTIFRLSNPPALAWTNLEFLVTATGSSTVLQFAAENNGSYFGLDDISLTPIPAVKFHSAVKAADTFNLTWTAATGLVYQVQYITNLAQANWSNLGAPIAPTNRTWTLSDTNAIQSSPQRFYRLILAP